MDSNTVQVTRWKRYGKDRLYVRLADETDVGFWDLVTDEAHPESPEHLITIVTAVKDWKATQSDDTSPACATATAGMATPATVVVEPVGKVAMPEPVATPIDPASDEEPPARPWLDLTTNRAGAEAREQALAARDAAPVKTLLARALRVQTDERAWRIGADGEELVAAQLAKAARKDPRWQFIHAIPVGNRGSNIDHLIIGPRRHLHG